MSSCQHHNITCFAQTVQTSDIIKNIRKSSNKTCGLDPALTWIIKRLPGTMAFQCFSAHQKHWKDSSSSDSIKLVGLHAFITARLDYCNSILYGRPKRLIQRLQRIQNTSCTTAGADPEGGGAHALPFSRQIL